VSELFCPDFGGLAFDNPFANLCVGVNFEGAVSGKVISEQQGEPSATRVYPGEQNKTL
jgi:hypothetical protein